MSITQPHGRIALTGDPVTLADRIASGQAVIVEGSEIVGISAGGELGTPICIWLRTRLRCLGRAGSQNRWCEHRRT